MRAARAPTFLPQLDAAEMAKHVDAWMCEEEAQAGNQVGGRVCLQLRLPVHACTVLRNVHLWAFACVHVCAAGPGPSAETHSQTSNNSSWSACFPFFRRKCCVFKNLSCFLVCVGVTGCAHAKGVRSQ